MAELPDQCVELVVTSPPYPMIALWDSVFAAQNPRIAAALAQKNGREAFELMHQELDKVWNEVFRVLKKGGLACINVGDATRTIGERFTLYPNHSRVHAHMHQLGFSALPTILWRKQTNAPNKFMGSGMMPPGAYVTLEHEYILIFRKGGKRFFKADQEKARRRESAYFWEERNAWFSDVWMDLKGTPQDLFDSRTRNRSAAFPLELPYRLISMFSMKGDTVLDPFLGIGSTMVAAMATGRNSVGYEIDTDLCKAVTSKLTEAKAYANGRSRNRLEAHLIFVEERLAQKGRFKHINRHYQFPVVTGQERDLLINDVNTIQLREENTFHVLYDDQPQDAFIGDWKDTIQTAAARVRAEKSAQKSLF
jgi:DNA modification methylase